MRYRIVSISSVQKTNYFIDDTIKTEYASFNKPYEDIIVETKYSMFESVIALSIVVISFVYLRLGKIFIINNSFVFFSLALMAVDITYISFKKHKIRPFHIVLFSIIILFNIAFTISSNFDIKQLATTFSTLLLFYSVFIIIGDRKPFSDILPKEMLNIIFVLPFKKFGSMMGALTYQLRKNNSMKNIKGIFLGLIIACPITIIIAKLLMNADKIFDSILRKIIPNNFNDLLLNAYYIAIAILMASYIFGLIVSSSDKHDISIKNSRNGLSSISLYTMVIPICFMYIIFFIVSLNYFTSAFSGNTFDGFSYSEYARKGFFELCAVSAINLSIIISLNLFCHKENGVKPKGIKFFTIFIIIASLTHIITALSKMVLYISNQGLTHLRVYTSWFMVLLFIFFIFILIKTINAKFKMYISMFCVFTIMLGGLCFSNVDYRIADFNIKGYINGDIEKLDMRNIQYNLSESAILAAVKYVDNDKVSDIMREYLNDIYIPNDDSNPLYWSFENYLAQNALDEYLMSAEPFKNSKEAKLRKRF